MIKCVFPCMSFSEISIKIYKVSHMITVGLQSTLMFFHAFFLHAHFQ